MNQLIKSLVRKFGYEVSKLPPPPSRALQQFLDGREPGFEPEAVDCSSVAEAGPQPSHLSGTPRSLIVEGWRFLPHSYAIVNQWQLLALARRPDISLKHLDAPIYRLKWPREEGLFASQDEQRLKAIARAELGDAADVMLRLFFPYDFSPSRARRTVVFGTSETQVLRRHQCTDFRMYEGFRRGVAPADVTAVTPSRWSAEGFYKSGFKPAQVLVVPHGVDIATFHPMPGLRDGVRRVISAAKDDFVFLSIGAMTYNKGIDLLIPAFAQVSRRFPNARLILKGMNPLYSSKDHLLKIMRKVRVSDQDRVISRISYYGSPFPNWKMALLYQGADAYVSPYRAEGFNMPVLEAAACGLPVICTGGGSTDDFVTNAFARKIAAQKVTKIVDDQEDILLEPDVAHLAALMISVIEDQTWRKTAAAAGPAHVQANYSWDQVVDRLVRGLWN